MMSSELQAVLEIAAAGSTLLFAALAGLIGLMYLLTAPWLGRRPATIRPDEADLPPGGASAGRGAVRTTTPSRPAGSAPSPSRWR